MSSLPLAQNLIEIQRAMTTSSTAIFMPFTTQELYQDRPEALYYGLNALSNNLIMVDRKALKNPNGLILGTPGSGKSFSAKREITNAFLVSNDDIIICDPEAEYAPLVQRLEGQVIKISPSSSQYVNPMDINLNYSEEDNSFASSFLFWYRSIISYYRHFVRSKFYSPVLSCTAHAAHSPTSAPNGGCSGCFVSVVLRVASAPRRADLGGYCE